MINWPEYIRRSKFLAEKNPVYWPILIIDLIQKYGEGAL